MIQIEDFKLLGVSMTSILLSVIRWEDIFSVENLPNVFLWVMRCAVLIASLVYTVMKIKRIDRNKKRKP